MSVIIQPCHVVTVTETAHQNEATEMNYTSHPAVHLVVPVCGFESNLCIRPDSADFERIARQISSAFPSKFVLLGI